MTRKEIAVNIGLVLAGSLIGSAFTFTSLASQYGTKIEAQEKTISGLTSMVNVKADMSSISELVTKADLRRLQDAIESGYRLQDRRDSEQDRQTAELKTTVSDQAKLLTSVDKKVDIVIALLREHRKESGD